MESMLGQTLGQYQLLEQIGQGGMATVYKGYQPALNRYVAIKVLPPYYAHDPGFAERFTREAQAIAQLEHPNILPVYDFGKQGDVSYIVMKYVPAGTLRDRLGQPLPPIDAVHLIEQIAAALDTAHDRGILHRDIKPGNILLDERGWVYLSDFGLAKMVEGTTNLTGTGVGVGTPAYMSPEQGQGLSVDARTDVYALGVVLFEMLTGRVPYRAETPMAVVIKHVTDPIPLPRRMNPNIPEAVEQVLLKALAKNPAHRFARAGDLAQALKRAVQGLEPAVAAAPIPPDPSATVLRRAAQPAPNAAPPAAATQNNWLLLMLGLIAVGAIGICGVVGLFVALKPPPAAPAPVSTRPGLMVSVISPTPTTTPAPLPPATTIAPTLAPPPEATGTPTETPSPTPTPSPSPAAARAEVLPGAVTPACARPLCESGQVYFCADTCPGDCGLQCATVSPTATPSPTPTETPSPTSTFTATPLPPRWNDTGLRPTGEFARIWALEQAEAGPLAYPQAAAVTDRLCARQQFERGYMLWVDLPENPDVIWATIGASASAGSGAKWYRLVDDWPGTPDFWCSEAEANAPLGPRRGFGKQWCAVPGLRVDLGQAVAEEKGGADNPRCELQFFQGGAILYAALDNAYLVLYDEGGWRRY